MASRSPHDAGRDAVVDAGSPPFRDQRPRWEHYIEQQFAGQHPLEVMRQIWAFNEPLYQRILRLVKAPAKVLEIGTGSGVNVARLSMLGYQASGLDNSEKIISLAREFAHRYHFDIKLDVADAFDLSAHYGAFDLVFSTGMIEHWSQDRLVAALREQARCARVVVAEIPTKHTHYAGPVTDEIHYSWRELKALFESAGLANTRTFGYGSVPNVVGVIAERYCPPDVLRYLRRTGFSAMALVCEGRRS